MERKRVYIGDIHMNAGKGFNPSQGRFPYEWLGPAEANRFAAFLNFLSGSQDLQEVVIIGDLMDDWVYPVDVTPPSLEEIIKAPVNKKIVQALKKLCKNKDITVLYLPGNHDMAMNRTLAEKYFPGMVFGGAARYNSVYRTSRLRAEHGSAHAMFNAPDAINNPGKRLPLGYFISRVVATRARDTGQTDRHYWTLADDLLETLGPQKLPASLFEALLEEAGLSHDTPILMPKQGKKTEKIPAAQVKETYADLFDQWEATYGAGVAFKAMMAEIGFLNNWADRLCKQSDTNVVIFGHSHDWDLDKDSWFVKDRIYANCGTWCDAEKPCTWVESQKDRGARRHFIRIMDWNDGDPVEIDTQDVPL